MKKIKVNLPFWVTVVTLVISALALLVSAYGIHKSTIDNRYNVSSLGDAIEFDRTFTKDDSRPYYTIDIEPCKGVVKYGFKQTSGYTHSGMTYKMFYKKTTSSTWIQHDYFYFKLNNVWTNGDTMVKANGTTDYNVKVLKYSGTSTKSRVLMDIFVD